MRAPPAPYALGTFASHERPHLKAHRRRHWIFARVYARLAPRSEAKGTAEHRRALLAGLSGRVVEVGCGTGLNFAHYPPAVSEVVAVEPEPYLRARAVVAAAGAGVGVTVRVMDGCAEAVPAGDGTFDAAVVSLVLCSVSDLAAALNELSRVLGPRGRLHFYEHVQGSSAWLRWLQRFASPFWGALAGGCHPGRDTVAAIERAGFLVEHIERFRFRPGPAVPLALGVTAHPRGRPTATRGWC